MRREYQPVIRRGDGGHFVLDDPEPERTATGEAILDEPTVHQKVTKLLRESMAQTSSLTPRAQPVRDVPAHMRQFLK